MRSTNHTLERRVAALECELSPAKAAVDWVERAAGFTGPLEYLQWLNDHGLSELERRGFVARAANAIFGRIGIEQTKAEDAFVVAFHLELFVELNQICTTAMQAIVPRLKTIVETWRSILERLPQSQSSNIASRTVQSSAHRPDCLDQADLSRGLRSQIDDLGRELRIAITEVVWLGRVMVDVGELFGSAQVTFRGVSDQFVKLLGSIDTLVTGWNRAVAEGLLPRASRINIFATPTASGPRQRLREMLVRAADRAFALLARKDAVPDWRRVQPRVPRLFIMVPQPEPPGMEVYPRYTVPSADLSGLVDKLLNNSERILADLGAMSTAANQASEYERLRSIFSQLSKEVATVAGIVLPLPRGSLSGLKRPSTTDINSIGSKRGPSAVRAARRKMEQWQAYHKIIDDELNLLLLNADPGD